MWRPFSLGEEALPSPIGYDTAPERAGLGHSPRLPSCVCQKNLGVLEYAPFADFYRSSRSNSMGNCQKSSSSCAVRGGIDGREGIERADG